MSELLDSSSSAAPTRATPIGTTCRMSYCLGPCATKPITLLEIGVLEGASLRAWHEYLPRASIVGVDKCHVPKTTDQTVRHAMEPKMIWDVVALRWADVTDAEFAQSLIEDFAPFDVIIDDGSHIASEQRTTFRTLWPHLAEGGFYAIEDIDAATFDMDHYNPDNSEAPWFWLTRWAIREHVGAWRRADHQLLQAWGVHRQTHRIRTT